MAELTIGQRIAQERKKLNISQVGLATQLDVSRQAISKWESDAAIPEIDKLIALSRLFGVSVGWLLGVEEQTLSREGALSEDQFKIVEELVKKYQTPPKPHLTIFHYLLVFAASLLIFLLMYGRMEQFLQYSEDIAALAERIDALENAGAGSDTLNVDTLLASYVLIPSVPDVGEFPGMSRGESIVTLKAVPRVWNTGDEGWFHIQSASDEFLEIPCRWDGNVLSATTQLPVADGYEYGFVVKHVGGSQEAQILQEETVQNLQSTFHIPAVHEIGTMEYADGTMILKDYASTFTMPGLYQQERFEEPGYYSDPYLAVWQKVEYVLLVNDNVSGAAYYRLPVIDRAEGLHPEDAFAYTLTVAEPELRFENIAVTNTTMHAQLWVYAYLDNGLQERYILNMFDYSDDSGFTELA